jgi:polyhydroxyalkanoate synthase
VGTYRRRRKLSGSGSESKPLSWAKKLATVAQVLADSPINEGARARLREKLGVAFSARSCIYSETCMKVYRYDPSAGVGTVASARENKERAEEGVAGGGLARPEGLEGVDRGCMNDGPRVLLIPSLINGPYIMDLLPRHSLVEGLVARGVDVYMLEWEMGERGLGGFDLAAVVDGCIPRAIKRVARLDRERDGLVVLGQCLGATLTAIALSIHPELADGLVSLTAPYDFEPDCLLKRWTSREVFYLDAVLAAFPGSVPHRLLQLAFPLLDTKSLVTKYRGLYERAESATYVRLFEALDLWTKDGGPVPSHLLEEIIIGFYRENRLVEGTLAVRGERVDLGRYRRPVLNLFATGDKIVARESAARLVELMTNVKNVELPTGHVTTVVGHPARKQTYDLIAEFVAEQCGQGRSKKKSAERRGEKR